SADPPLAHPPDGVTGPRPEWVSLDLRDRAGEKIKDGRHVGLDFYDLLIEGRRATPLRCWSDVVPAQDITHSLVRNLKAQIGQRTHDAVISPATVLRCQPHYQRLHFGGDPWAAGIGPTAGAIELLRHQSSIPGEKGIRFGNAHDILQSFATEALGHLCQSGSLRIRQPEPGG